MDGRTSLFPMKTNDSGVEFLAYQREEKRGGGKKRDVTFRARNRGNDNGGRNMAEGEPPARSPFGWSGVLDVMSPLRYKVRDKAHNPTAALQALSARVGRV